MTRRSRQATSVSLSFRAYCCAACELLVLSLAELGRVSRRYAASVFYTRADRSAKIKAVKTDRTPGGWRAVNDKN